MLATLTLVDKGTEKILSSAGGASTDGAFITEFLKGLSDKLDANVANECMTNIVMLSQMTMTSAHDRKQYFHSQTLLLQD